MDPFGCWRLEVLTLVVGFIPLSGAGEPEDTLHVGKVAWRVGGAGGGFLESFGCHFRQMVKAGLPDAG